jgi:transcriptional regulator with XRE-family HTH domain
VESAAVGVRAGRGDAGLGVGLEDDLDDLVRVFGHGEQVELAEAAAAINASEGAETISATYLWQLKTGRRDNPTYKHLIALARFFGVSPAFFFPDSETGRGEVPAEVKLALQDDSIRQIALRAAGLSERSLAVIADMVSNARTLEDSQPRRSRRATQQADDT